MDIETYQKRRQQQEKQKTQYREICCQCRQPNSICYCSKIKSFDPKIKFIILIHPVEERRRIATGRMSHLCLKNSELIAGQDYSNNNRVNEIIQDSQYSSVILYPGRSSINLSLSKSDKGSKSLFSEGKTPVIFVIDGTWATARKMVRQSSNLAPLPRICFTPLSPSRFRVRKQPSAECYSTIEAIHQIIELLSDDVGFSVKDRTHDGLLNVFDFLVETQIKFLQQSFDNPRPNAYRRPKIRIS